MRFSGLLQLDARPLANERALAISTDMARLLASTETDDEGRFVLDAPDVDEATLLVKVQGPVVAVAHRVVDAEGPHEFLLEADDLHSIRGTIKTTSGWPPYLTVFVNPVHLDGVPAQLEPFFERRDANVVESTFFKQRVDGREFELKLQAGTYSIGGSHLNYRRPMLIEPDFENYVVASAEADGEGPLPGNTSSGYTVDVTRDREVRLTIEPVPDEALSPGSS